MPDPQVTEALRILSKAKALIDKAMDEIISHQNVDSLDFTVNDNFPNGIHDYARMVHETIMRTYLDPTEDQAQDMVAYSAFFSAWVLAGMPKSQFREMFQEVYKGRDM